MKKALKIFNLMIVGSKLTHKNYTYIGLRFFLDSTGYVWWYRKYAVETDLWELTFG